MEWIGPVLSRAERSADAANHSEDKSQCGLTQWRIARRALSPIEKQQQQQQNKQTKQQQQQQQKTTGETSKLPCIKTVESIRMFISVYIMIGMREKRWEGN